MPSEIHRRSTPDRLAAGPTVSPEAWAEKIAAQCDAICTRIEAINAGLRAGLEPFRCDRCGRMRPCACDRAR